MPVSAEDIVPVDSWVLLRVLPKKEHSKLIVRPSGTFSEKTGHSLGTVLKVGQGVVEFDSAGVKRRKPLGVVPGDVVLFRSYLKDVQTMGVTDSDVGLIHYKDLMAVVS